MPAAQRERIEEVLLEAVERAEAAHLASLSPEEQLEFAEGEPHFDAKSEARETLRAFFSRIGRPVYVAVELPVLYPGEESFTPDLMAVRDTTQRKRDAWVVVKEGKGIDLALEILNKGDRRKDLVDNVERYAHLGVREYFVFDVRRGRLHAYHLTGPAARRYTPVMGNGGRYRSEVLELDLAVVGGQLRFYMGTAELSTKDEELARLGRLVQEEQARAEQEQARAEQACQKLAEGILTMARLRGLVLADEDAGRIRATTDVELLSRWMERIATLSPEDLGNGRLFQDG